MRKIKRECVRELETKQKEKRRRKTINQNKKEEENENNTRDSVVKAGSLRPINRYARKQNIVQL